MPEFGPLRIRSLARFRIGLGMIVAGLGLALWMLHALGGFASRVPLASAGLVAGVCLLAGGGLLVARAHEGESAPARRLPRLGVCLVYFCPFLLWFFQKPGVYYLAINIILMVICLTGWLVAFNEHLARLAQSMGNREFRIEASVIAWACLVMLSFLLVFLLARVIAYQLEIGGDRFPAMLLAPWRPVLFAPCALTAAMALRAFYLAGAWTGAGDPRAD